MYLKKITTYHRINLPALLGTTVASWKPSILLSSLTQVKLLYKDGKMNNIERLANAIRLACDPTKSELWEKCIQESSKNVNRRGVMAIFFAGVRVLVDLQRFPLKDYIFDYKAVFGSKMFMGNVPEKFATNLKMPESLGSLYCVQGYMKDGNSAFYFATDDFCASLAVCLILYGHIGFRGVWNLEVARSGTTEETVKANICALPSIVGIFF